MNTRRENRLEELGRVDAEKAYTSRGKRNLKEEKSRIRKELAKGGKAGQPDPSRGGRKKFGPGTSGRQGERKGLKTHGGGPDAGNIGKIRDSLREFKKMPKIPKRKKPSPEDMLRIKDMMQYPPKRKYKPLRVKKRNGGSAAEHYLQHGYGPHKSSGKVLKGKKIGIQIK